MIRPFRQRRERWTVNGWSGSRQQGGQLACPAGAGVSTRNNQQINTSYWHTVNPAWDRTSDPLSTPDIIRRRCERRVSYLDLGPRLHGCQQQPAIHPVILDQAFKEIQRIYVKVIHLLRR